jgi:hypothetical protein
MLTEQNQASILQFYKAFDDRKADHALELLVLNLVAHLASRAKSFNGEKFKQFGV